MGTDQLTLTIATSIYGQDTISNFVSPMLLFPNADSTFPSPTPYTGHHIGAVLSQKWGLSQYYNVTFLSRNLIRFFYLGRMLNSYLSQVSGVCSTS